MAKPVDWEGLTGYQNGHEEVVCIEATCPTGCEPALLTELSARMPSASNARKHQGRVFFDIPLTEVPKVLDLRIVDNAFVIVHVIPKIEFPKKKAGLSEKDLDPEAQKASLEQLAALVDKPDFLWEKGLKAWNTISKFYPSSNQLIQDNFETPVAEKKQKLEDVSNGCDDQKENTPTPSIPSFRCTCYRSGQNCHAFGSMDVQVAVGGAIQDRFQWKVQMKNSDLDIAVNVDINQVYAGIKITKDSLFKRNIEHFGPTTLRATICAGLLRYANIKPGEIVVDPMCGGGSIPIEGTLSDPTAFYLGGEIHEKAIERCAGNQKAVQNRASTDFVRWDITKIPLRDNSIDVLVTDLPFGKRSGSKADNRVLYPRILNSMARVVKPTTGRAVLLTQDKNSMFKTLHKVSKHWKCHRQYGVNIGGLSALIYVMSRTDSVDFSTKKDRLAQNQANEI